MNTKILDYFIAIAEEKSISRAAERFYLTDSALRKHVRNLEKELGAPLFRYDQEGMRLTQEGVIFINNAQAIRHLEQEMERTLSTLNQQKSKVITVAVDDAYYNCIVRELMPSFQQTYADWKVELLKCNAVQARKLVLNGGADFAVLSAAQAKLPELETMRVMVNHTYCAYPLDFPDPLEPDALERAISKGLLPVLHPVGNTIRMLEEQRLMELGILPPKILEGNYLNAIQDIINGVGIGFLPEAICDIYRQKSITVGSLFMQFYTLIAYRPNRIFNDVCRELMERILRVVSGGGLTTPYRGAKQGTTPAGKP